MVLSTPRSALVPSLLVGLQHERAGAVAEQHAGRAVGPVHQARHGLRADQKHGLGLPGLDEIVGDREAVDEAGTHRLHVEGRAARHAEPRLDNVVAVAGKVSSGVVVATMMRSTSPASMAASLSAARAASTREVRGVFALARDAPFADAGALADPFVAGIDALRQFVVGDDVLRQIRHRNR